MVEMLCAIDKHSRNRIGGKAASLIELIEAGYTVPPGFVIMADDYARFQEYNNIESRITEALSRLSKSNYQEISKQIQDFILNNKIPPELQKTINTHLSQLGVNTVSIRSSAVDEDSNTASFAGLHDSFLNIPADIGPVLPKVKACWASGFTDRALAYRLRRNLQLTNSIAVVVQKMIDADISGTMFTVHPETGEKHKLIIESSWGLGEAVVSGSVTPDRFVVDKTKEEIIKKEMGSKKLLFTTHATGVVEQETEKSNREKYSLDETIIKRLAEIGKSIEKLFGEPQDIEWCKSNDQIWVLQARPITTVNNNGS